MILPDPISLAPRSNRVSRTRVAVGGQETMVASEPLIEHNFYGVSRRLTNCGL